MAIIAPLFAFIGRFIGRLVNLAFGWATVMLFGRVPDSKKLLLSGVALGSIAWVAVLIGVVVPDAGTFLIAAVPAPDFIGDEWLRVAMLIAAIVLPLLVGIGGLFLMDAADRPTGIGGKFVQVLRGYPYALVLASVLAFLIVVAPLRKVRTIFRRWEDAHIPVIVQPGGYETVADDIEAALDVAELGINRAKAPAILEAPSKLLAAVGGGGVRRLVPDRLLVLKNRALEVTIYPSDVAMAGTKEQVARSRAAIASTLTFTAAWMTTSREAQEIEDALREISISREPQPWRRLDAIDKRLARLVVGHEDWEVLYRQRLQVERNLRRAEDRAEGEDGAGDDRRGGPLAALAHLIRSVTPD